MTISDYASLKSAVIDWSHRDDQDLRIDQYIQICETAFQTNRVAPLKINSQDTLVSATLDSVTPSRFLALPAGYESLRTLKIVESNVAPVELVFLSSQSLNVKSGAGFPRYFTVTSRFEFDRVPDKDYPVEIQYWKKFTGLSSSNTTNDVVMNFPNIYLFGTLWALHTWTGEPEEASKYEQMFLLEVQGANKITSLGKYGPTPAIRTAGATP